MAARGVWDAEVAGSNPAAPTTDHRPPTTASNDVRKDRGTRDSTPGLPGPSSSRSPSSPMSDEALQGVMNGALGPVRLGVAFLLVPPSGSRGRAGIRGHRVRSLAGPHRPGHRPRRSCSGWRSPTSSIRAGPASPEPGSTPPALGVTLQEAPLARRLPRSGADSHAVTGAM